MEKSLRPSKPLDLDSLAHLAPELAATIAAIASDVALVVDEHGIVQNVAIGRDSVNDAASAWVGKSWADTATKDTKKKVQLLLDDAIAGLVTKRREINHTLESGGSLPMTYAAVRLGAHGPVLIAGRDLRAIAAIEERFLASQQEMERSYWAQRQSEARYRMLFQVATDAVLVVDAETLVTLESNPAAQKLLSVEADKLIGTNPFQELQPSSRRAAQEMLVTARSSGKPAEIRVRLTGGDSVLTVSATPFRGDREMLLLVRFSLVDESQRSSAIDGQISGAVRSMSEAVLIADSGGRLLMANPAFLSLCGLSSEQQIKGLSISEWLSDTQNDLSRLLAEIRCRGMTRTVPALVKNLDGQLIPVQMFAALLTDGEQEHIGITLSRKPAPDTTARESLTQLQRLIEDLADRIGDQSMMQILLRVQDATARHFSRAALQLAQGDMGRAATLLSLSLPSFERHLAGHPQDMPDAPGDGGALH